MVQVLTFWMTVVGTLSGVISMVIACLDRRGPRQPRKGPSDTRQASESCLYAAVMIGGMTIVISAVIVNFSTLWARFDISPLACAIGIAVNVLGVPLDRYLNDGPDEKWMNKAYTVFCLPFIAGYAVLLIVK